MTPLELHAECGHCRWVGPLHLCDQRGWWLPDIFMWTRRLRCPSCSNVISKRTSRPWDRGWTTGVTFGRIFVP